MSVINLDIQDNQETAKYTFKDSINVKIILDTEFDLTDATTCIIKVKKPDDSKQEWSAFVDTDNNQYIYHLTEVGDLDQVGKYEVQAYIEFSDGTKLYGDIDVLEVKEHI